MSSETLVETIQRGEYTVEIHVDQDPINPREYDSDISGMVCTHTRASLGDEKARAELITYLQSAGDLDFDDDVHPTAEQLAKRAGCTVLPLYLYEHGAMTMATTPFSCPFDSGRIGYIYMTKETAKEQELQGREVEVLKAQVDDYAKYLEGSVYGYVVLDKVGFDVDSCWGFLGNCHKVSGLMEAVDSFLETAPMQLPLDLGEPK